MRAAGKEQLKRHYETMTPAAEAARVRDEATAEIECKLIDLGFTFYAYWRLRPTYGPRTPLFASNYPKPWLNRHLQRGYDSYDLVALTASRQRTPFLWTEITRRRGLTPGQRRVFTEAATFGLRAGGAIPIHGPGQGKALLAVACDMDDDEFSALFERRLGALSVLARAIHQVMHKTELPVHLDPTVALSLHQAEALMLTARGYTREEIAGAMSISKETAKDHVERACERLGATNKTHAVAIAMWHGLILP